MATKRKKVNKIFNFFRIKIIYLILRWTDGSFMELNSEIVEGECEEFTREIYKIHKQFSNSVKKRKIELQTRVGEKRKSKSK